MMLQHSYRTLAGQVLGRGLAAKGAAAGSSGAAGDSGPATVMDTSYFIPMMVSAGVFFAGYAWLKHVKKKREARRQRQGKGG